MSEVKYIKTEDLKIIVFSEYNTHSDFESFHPISAGFITFFRGKHNIVCKCYGGSISLKMKSNPKEDTKLALEQIIGLDHFIHEEDFKHVLDNL